MTKPVKVAQQDEEAVVAEQIWDKLVAFVEELRRFYLLYFVYFGILAVLCVVMYVVEQPIYTATATIGPPSASPVSSLMTNFDGSPGSSVKRLLGAASGGAQNDPFQEYLQVLHSSRLAAELAEKDNLLPKLFSNRWDAEHKRWRPPSLAHNMLAVVNGALHRPVRDYPDANSLEEVLGGNLHVTEASTGAASILSMGSGFMIASLKYSSPEEARDLLNTILSRADSIIRQEQQRDVLARISYIKAELPNITQTEQRETLIGILSGQEELNIMLVADKRYAFTIVDPPHASPIPSFPPSPTLSLLLSAFAAFVLLVATVFAQAKLSFVRALIAPLERPRTFGGLSTPPAQQRRPVSQTFRSETVNR
jgi:hypothetical protein